MCSYQAVVSEIELGNSMLLYLRCKFLGDEETYLDIDVEEPQRHVTGGLR